MLCSATSPASFVAMVNGEKTVIKIGASSTRLLRMSRTASSSRPSAPAPGSSGRRRPQLGRRAFLAGSAAVAATARAPFVHAQKRGGTLRFVPHADLKVLDPIWTTAYITRNHGYMIFDTLFGLDANFKIKPQMVDKYTVSKDAMKYSFTLRDGLKFHDGVPVTAEDCVASIERWGARDSALGRLMMAAVNKMAPVDGKTFTIDRKSVV